LALSSWLAGPLVAAKGLVALSVVLLPLGTVRLLVALKRSPRLGLLAFALCWDHNLSWGFVAFTLGLGMGLFALAGLLEAESPHAALKKWPLWVALALTHAHAFGIMVLAAPFFALGGKEIPRRLKTHLAGVLPGVAILIPWIVGRALFGGAHESKTVRPTEFHDLQVKLERFFGYTLDVIPGETSTSLLGGVLIGLIFLAVVFSFIQQEKWVTETRGAMAFFAVALGLYLLLPMTIYWPIEQWYIYPRQATVLLLFAPFVPRPNLEGKAAWLLIPVVLLGFVAHLTVAQAHRGFAKRAGDFLEILQAVPPNARLLTLTLDDHDPDIKLGPYNQFHAYAVAEKGGYDPYLFDNPSHPIVHNKENALPHPRWNQMHAFSLEKHGVFYDVILVQGKRRDPVARQDANQTLTRLIKEAGRWRLYQVLNPHGR
jgi:hypothetical protein